MIKIINFRVFYFEKNMGHGVARRKGLSEASNNIVALMDSDDISLPFRFEKQLKCFVENPMLGIVGGQISEFIGEPNHVIGIRDVPEKDCDIKQYMKKRCPMNQVTVMLKKDEVERAGGYIDWYCEEDYYLWVRMALMGCVFHNVPDILVNVRVGNEMSARRGGIKYFKSEVRMQKFLFASNLINLWQYIWNVLIRFAGEVVLPNFIRTRILKFFRKPVTIFDKKNLRVKLMNNGKRDATKYPSFSVSICVYEKDSAEQFDAALNSIINQTVEPREIVLVVDGPISSDIQQVIDKYSEICKGVAD